MEHRKIGLVEKQTYIEQQVMELGNGKLIKLNLYSLQLSGEKSGLLYKRDINLPQDITGRIMKYRVSNDGIIYNSSLEK